LPLMQIAELATPPKGLEDLAGEASWGGRPPWVPGSQIIELATTADKTPARTFPTP